MNVIRECFFSLNNIKFQLCLISYLHNTVIEWRENTKTYQNVNHGEAITATELFE